MTRAKAESPLRRTVRRMAARQLGLANGEVPGASVRQVQRIVQHMVKSDELFTFRLTGKVVRHFVDEADGRTWLAAVRENARKPAPLARRRPCSDETVLDDGPRAPWPASAQPYFPKHADGTPAWKFTRCPAPFRDPLRTNTYAEH